jgi:hypothetical protein
MLARFRLQAMKKTIIVVIALVACSTQALSQKGSSIWGDVFTGQVVKADETSREITLEYAGKDGTETFVGALKEGYQVKTEGGGAHELKISELAPGIRIRAYYKKISKEVNGQKVKANLITSIVFLGRDEFAFMRRYLNVEPSAPVTLVESKTLPDADPLRLKIAGDNPAVRDEIIKWTGEWNKREAKKYGAVRVVPDSEQADVALVIHKGSDSKADVNFPTMSGFLVVERPTGLEVIWKDYKLLEPEQFVMLNPDYAGQIPGLGVRIAGEIEKRLKFRHKEKQK